MKDGEETDRGELPAPRAAADPPPGESRADQEPGDGARARSLLPRLDWALIRTTLAVKFFVIALGGITYKLWEDKPFDSPLLGWLHVWNRWDALSYQAIAQHGYQTGGEERLNLVFFPLYPLLVRAVAFVARDYVLSAFIVSGVASICAVLLLRRLASLDEPDETASRAAWLLLIFPTSYFLHIGYTESLFLALVLGCFLAARRGDWPLAGSLGLLAGLCRTNGLLLFPALLAEAALEYRARGRRRWAWLWSAGPLAGFACYLWLNYSVAGHALAFLSYQQENWRRSFVAPWTGLWMSYMRLWRRSPAQAHMGGFEELFFALMVLVAVLFCARRLRPSYTVWMALNWLLFTSTSYVLSVPRYTLTLFPLYILLARLCRQPFWYEIVTVWSLLFLALFAGLFASGRWAF